MPSEALQKIPPLLDTPPAPWKTRQDGAWTIQWAGRPGAAEALAKLVKKVRGLPPANEIGQVLSVMNTPFAVILAGPDGVLACVDQNRTFPVVYVPGADCNAVSADARSVVARFGLEGKFCREAVLEAAMSGYVTGTGTLIDGLRQLVAGSWLLWARLKPKPMTGHYFRYTPLARTAQDEAGLIEAQAEVTDRAFRRLIADADGAPVWISMSGGLDSRLIVAKLHELGCPNIQTFTYGLPGNSEAQVARKVAERLGLPWLFVPTRRAQVRRAFDGPARQDYWRFADGFVSVPNPHDFHAILDLVESGRMQEGAVIVNGQTGDFTSGGHLPRGTGTEAVSFARTAEIIVDKHYDLWRSLRQPKTLDLVTERIAASVGYQGGYDDMLAREESNAILEQWEHQERQSKYVINQQRAYEFFDLRWQLPLWDMDLVDYWRRVPYRFKIGQALYIAYLKKWDYRQLFSALPENVSAWGARSWYMVPISSVLHKAVPARFHRMLAKMTFYNARFGHHYSAFPLSNIIACADDARGPVSFYVRRWLEEKGIDFEDLRAWARDPASAGIGRAT